MAKSTNKYVEKENHVELHVIYHGQEKVFLLTKEDAEIVKQKGSWAFCPYTGRIDLRCQSYGQNSYIKKLLGVKDVETYDLTNKDVSTLTKEQLRRQRQAAKLRETWAKRKAQEKEYKEQKTYNQSTDGKCQMMVLSPSQIKEIYENYCYDDQLIYIFQYVKPGRIETEYYTNGFHNKNTLESIEVNNEQK